MIITEMHNGQGFGNQLFCYVTTRCIAVDKGVEFGLKSSQNLGGWGADHDVSSFMDLYLGEPIDESKIVNFYRENEVRLKINNGQFDRHDEILGCDIRSFDHNLVNVPDNTHIEGLMQSEDYFYHRKEEVKQWLKVKPEYDCYDFFSDNICVLQIRYYGNDVAVQLSRDYWVRAIYHMLSINPDMVFIVITNDKEYVEDLLPELKDNILSFSMGKDYAIVKNAKYLILGNSSFPFFAAWTSEVNKFTIAPKYWARHNVSDGYWCLDYNMYRGWYYIDREGNLQTYDECKRELELYKAEHPEIYKK
jgi:hypothetical protein